jgi:hypothetical protein
MGKWSNGVKLETRIGQWEQPALDNDKRAKKETTTTVPPSISWWGRRQYQLRDDTGGSPPDLLHRSTIQVSNCCVANPGQSFHTVLLVACWFLALGPFQVS